MMDHAFADDSEARRRAVDPAGSFIVQAPAGSGKTELLIQRYLMLLAHVDRPEEIVAITFTRKAAAEMRKRVLDSLAEARRQGSGDGSSAKEPHRALTLAHARRALERDRIRGWGLQDNPARLRIQTIDALCASLTRQMPVLSAFGAQPESVDDASALCQQAARATLARLDEQGEAADCVARLLQHLDNNIPVAEALLAGMLKRREHWLRNLHAGLDRESLERSLAEEGRAAVARVLALMPAGSQELLALDASAAECHAFAQGLLTREGGWRKRSAQAQAFAEAAHGESLRLAIEALRRVPPPRYNERQWEALAAIMRLLPWALAELKLAFAFAGKADFAEIALRALAALGEPEAPTDLLLALDYRIRHLLVDEFQDTSLTQYRLLEKLTEGWEPGDGRTLFLVGDPMQSIYRFREAEVGLFLRARRDGIGSTRLEPLTLSVNFRSQADIVHWVNRAFADVMPPAEDIGAGAVPYSRSEPARPPQEEAVTVHAFFNGDAAAEARRVAALVTDAQSAHRDGTIAILVRSRPHLAAIVPALQRAGLRFRAIEIEPLGRRPVVQDLLALTRALLHAADRTAWLAVLRAPWGGLTLADLHALCATKPAPSPHASQAPLASPGTIDLFPETLTATRPPVAALRLTDTRTIWEMLNDE
jgi:ATP-dependent exoDNAse (exonuclease V) beta subunit